MNLTRRDLQAMPLKSLHQARNWSKADVFGGEQDSIRFVLKDFRRAPLWFKPIARNFLRREWKALRALDGEEHVPRALAHPDADSIVIEHAPGEQMDKMAYGTVPHASIEMLIELVKKLHARGVTHGDLHQQNVLVDDNGQICLIDWATAHVFHRPHGVRKWLFEEFSALDRRALAKIKVHHAPDLVTEEDLDLIRNGASRAYRSVKKVRRVGEVLRGKKRFGGLERKIESLEETRSAAETDGTS